MILTIANVSTVSMEELGNVVDAIQKQVDTDFSPEWGGPHKLKPITLDLHGEPAPVDEQDNAVIYFGDRASDPANGVNKWLGYHFINHANVAYGFVFLDVAAQYGLQWSVTLSHEVLELLADPTTVESRPGPSPYDVEETVQYYLEVCDPVQRDSYKVDAVDVSNFVTKKWFGLPSNAASTVYKGDPLDPFTVRTTGYMQYIENNEPKEFDGPELNAQRAAGIDAARASMQLGRRGARRAATAYLAAPRPPE